MKIAYLHYHLKPGGVTTVIRHQARAVANDCETLILSSAVPDNARDFDAPVSSVPLLAYDTEIPASFTPAELAGSIQMAIQRKWPGGCDVLHVHNSTLAKNKHLLDALDILRDQGIRLFVQIHDFAEDGRPEVYSKRGYTENVHYGVINSRDYHILRHAGLKGEGLHMIPNQVSPLLSTPPRTWNSNGGMVLYPVRGIRRKNIGEALLLSLFLPKNNSLGITLPPNSPKDFHHYGQWKKFVQSHHLDIRFGVGEHAGFQELVQNAPFIITTSVNEGFGFAFLEPWTAGKMVFGRYLNHVCRDFQDNGVRLEHLYHSFNIPIEAIDTDNNHISFHLRWKDSLMAHAKSFGMSFEPAELEQAYYSMTRNRTIDFGVLDEITQREALENIMRFPSLKTKVRRLNSWIRYRLEDGPDIDTILHNDWIVRSTYNRERYRERLISIYQTVATAEIEHRIHRETVLKAFLDPTQYKMLRWPVVSGQ